MSGQAIRFYAEAYPTRVLKGATPMQDTPRLISGS